MERDNNVGRGVALRSIEIEPVYTTVRSDSYCSRSGLFFMNAREILLFASIALTYNGTAANKRTLHACALTHDDEC